MIQPTSTYAYQRILPKLGKKQKAVLDLLRAADGPMTNAEIAAALSWPINTVTPRVGELREMGLVKDYGVRACKETGNAAETHGVVDGKLTTLKEKRYPFKTAIGVSFMTEAEGRARGLKRAD